jgi:hypothetical protein
VTIINPRAVISYIAAFDDEALTGALWGAFGKDIFILDEGLRFTLFRDRLAEVAEVPNFWEAYLSNPASSSPYDGATYDFRHDVVGAKIIVPVNRDVATAVSRGHVIREALVAKRGQEVWGWDGSSLTQIVTAPHDPNLDGAGTVVDNDAHDAFLGYCIRR